MSINIWFLTFSGLQSCRVEPSLAPSDAQHNFDTDKYNGSFKGLLTPGFLEGPLKSYSIKQIIVPSVQAFEANNWPLELTIS
eukprot:16430519-Heterocapsa_arctica.AAC.1